jgi:uncharacterized hydrophobic protein (TIGR00271 family)
MAEDTAPGATKPEPRGAPPIPAKPLDESFAKVILSWRRWWRDVVVETVDQAAVIEKRRLECRMSARYMFMSAMSGGIAILGLLLSSPAVVIGAMLLSPLMDPIMGLGFALAVGDYRWLRQSARSLLWGSLIAVVLCALIVFLSPLQSITPEIAARTRPNLFDLMVALFSALAGAYAMIRGREGTIVGVAIATALMPPLAVVGFGFATFNWPVFSGSLILFVTNLITIAFIAALMARLYGFRTALSQRHSRVQNAIMVTAFVGLMVPLALSLTQIANEATGARAVRTAILDNFDPRSRLSEVNIDWDSEPVAVNATVLTPSLDADAEGRISAALQRALDEPVALDLTQYQVGTSGSAAQQVQLARARAQAEAAAAERAEELAERLALVAGVPVNDVLVDRSRRRALVSAEPIEGATLAAYREFEQRIAATEPEWRVELRPPLRALPAVPIEVDEEGNRTIGAEGRNALEIIAWAISRSEVPVTLAGPVPEILIARDWLQARNISVNIESGSLPVRARWNPPDGAD